MNLLLIEDSKDIAEVIFEYFELQGASIDYAFNGRHGLELALNQQYDLIILDIMLPELDGFSVCRRLREEGVDVPILMLTSMDTQNDILKGFDLGADDYLVKPFDLAILEARSRALVQRYKGEMATKKLQFEDLTLDIDQHTLTRNKEVFRLNPTHFMIMRLLIKSAPGVVSRQQLVEALWGDDEPESDLLRNHIYQLRNVVDKRFDHAYIRTVSKVGYQLVSPTG